MTIKIREGFSIRESDSERIKKLKDLEKNHFITTVQIKSLPCSKCGLSNPVSESIIENFIICSRCKTKNNIHKSIKMKKIQKVCKDEILLKITDLINNTKIPFSYDKERWCWLVEVNNKTIPVIIPEYTNSYFLSAYSEDQATLFITLDKDSNLPLMDNSNSEQFLEFVDIYDDDTMLINRLENISNSFDQNISFELMQRFDFLINVMTFADFEKFCYDVLEQIRHKDAELEKFYKYLTKRKYTLVNSKIIRLGGPSNADFYIIDLVDYLKSGLKPDLYGEVKRYKSSSFNLDEFSKAIIHANIKPCLFMLATNKVQIEVWKKVIDFSNNGIFNYVILDKDLILILIKCLNLENVLTKYEELCEISKK